MSPNRRDFMKIAAGLGLAAAAPGVPARATVPVPPLTPSWMFLGVHPWTEGITGGSGAMHWYDDRGWVLEIEPHVFDMHRLRDPDDRYGILAANDYATPSEFLDAVVRMATEPVAHIERVERATDYHDYADTYPTGTYYPAPDEPEADLINWFHTRGFDGGFSIIDTRHAISEHRPWANAVIRPRQHGYQHLRYYAKVRYSWD